MRAHLGCACTGGNGGCAWVCVHTRGTVGAEVTVGELVSVVDAARAVDRSRDTVRRWVRAGRLTRHLGPLPAGGGSAPVLVDLDELRRLVVELGLEAEPVRVTAAPAPPPARDEIGALRDELAALRVELAEVRGREALAQREAHLAREALLDARTDRDAWRARVEAMEAELGATRALARVPWWRRLLTG